MVLLGVAMDEAATLQSTVEPFRLKFFPQFRTWVRGEPDMDTLVSVVDPAWNEILPTSYLIDRNGKVIKKIQGKKTREEFRALVDAAL
jgi:glutathione peroxidase-family protein